MSEKICIYCGQSGHRAHACTKRPELPGLSSWQSSQPVIDYGVQCAEFAFERERASLLRKFDGYVPADQVASLRWRVAELEAQVARMQTAFRVIERSAYTAGGELFPVGPADIQFGAGGNGVASVTPPWRFLQGEGPTLLDAIEDHLRKTGGEVVGARLEDGEDLAEHPAPSAAGGPPIDFGVGTMKIALFTSQPGLGEVITDPAAIAAAFERDALVSPDGC